MRFSALKQLAFASLAVAAATQVQAETPAQGLQIRGFVDAQYKWQKSQDITTGAVINDGALYFSHKTGDTELFVDLPFAWAGNAGAALDGNGDGVADSNTNNFLVGQVKPQAFLTHTFGATKLQLGQFDTIYGLELNDSPDIFFTAQGELFNRMLPLTHTGAVVAHTVGPVTAKVLAANSRIGKGDSGAQLSGHGEYGATVGYADEMFRAGVGYLTGRIVGLDSKNRTFTDVLLGGTFGPLAVDLEYSMEKYGDNDQGTGFVVLPVYSITPDFGVAVRFEQLDKVGLPSTEKVTSISGGVKYQVNGSLTAKADYTSLKTKNAGTDNDDSKFALAAVYKF